MELCDRCLGRRVIGAAGQAAEEEAGRARRGDAPAPAPADCPVCEGAFADKAAWVEAALAAVDGYAFATFQVGTRFPAACEEAERRVAEEMGAPLGETVRTEANRLLAEAIAEATGAHAVTEGRPELVIHVDTRFWTATARANSLFVGGRYTKHRRDLPQTHWPCRRCQGRGCYECDDAGVLYASSVEDEVARVLVPAFGAEGASFHGAGREDIDALMLGAGRPFVLEIHDPKRRVVELGTLEAALEAAAPETGVGVQGLRPSSKEEVQRIKDGGYDKAYLAHCEAEADVDEATLRGAAADLSGTTLEQRTPQRVAHRRADLVRRRTVHEVRPESFEDARRFTLWVLAESGTYIKEFVSGDEGRTTPSLSARLGVACRVAALDVVGILDDA